MGKTDKILPMEEITTAKTEICKEKIIVKNITEKKKCQGKSDVGKLKKTDSTQKLKSQKTKDRTPPTTTTVTSSDTTSTTTAAAVTIEITATPTIKTLTKATVIAVTTTATATKTLTTVATAIEEKTTNIEKKSSITPDCNGEDIQKSHAVNKNLDFTDEMKSKGIEKTKTNKEINKHTEMIQVINDIVCQQNKKR